MKKILSVLLSAALLAGCSAPAVPQASPESAHKLRVVATIFPVYDWVREVAGPDAANLDLTLLLDGSTDLHSYQPSAQDVAAIAGCDLFVYVGGASDAWVADALQESPNPDRQVVNLMELLGSRVYEEETVEGMEPEDHDDHDHGEEETDEHIWTSLQNAAELSAALGDALGELDPANAARYTENAAAYGEKLTALDGDYAAAVEAAPVKTLLFGDRFPFRYLVEDYGLAYYAAFPGCSAETEASFETVAFLAGKAAELDLPAVLTIEGSDQKIARTIVENAGGDRAILTLDAMQGTSSADIAAGTTYLSVMEQNLTVLRQALGAGEEA
ncbi:metal ABC transporter substrate-binding protein [Subdoligranulum variabile]|uniref:ABC transporter, substrate-binding protein n=1 Tax=Subdoligranulum variabile DSM 15176 TaxID=411471 RepID=D1PI71_9FIRM|nr:metal ABC transporter substrate-binding protein [Subdoligranulum variabile]EFB77607.1 ABC transporter, substrate-binding protein [Subdoligranulum variabile DSM 15176]UWP67149.1 metal ABC transporter substrate-binding protein [Subdoligranulum variabile]